jgi:hypothetical protein
MHFVSSRVTSRKRCAICTNSDDDDDDDEDDDDEESTRALLHRGSVWQLSEHWCKYL